MGFGVGGGMLIQGELDTYIVKWGYEGISYAVPKVYRKKKVKFLPITTNKKVWKGHARACISAEKMHPKEMEDWFQESVDDYESYIKAWSSWKS